MGCTLTSSALPMRLLDGENMFTSDDIFFIELRLLFFSSAAATLVLVSVALPAALKLCTLTASSSTSLLFRLRYNVKNAL